MSQPLESLYFTSSAFPLEPAILTSVLAGTVAMTLPFKLLRSYLVRQLRNGWNSTLKMRLSSYRKLVE